jgi:signal transduction histidine kinase
MARTTEGKPLMMFGTYADISDRKKADAEIEVKNAQLLLANMEKDKFFSIIAHDLRSPFNGFLGLTQMLADDLDTMSLEDIREIALVMRRSAVNVFSLLENLMEWSRINRGITAYEPKQLFLASSVTEAITSIAESAVKKGVNISLDIPQEVQVFADEYMLASIIRNLTSNALKFTHHGGIITISVIVTTGDSATISIRDTGIGMKKEMLSNLFRFDLQTNRKGTEGEPSSGLGLIICKEFIEKHGGKFWVESEEGKGSCFSFSIPSQ